MAEMATTFFVDSEVDEIEVSLLRLTRRTLSLKEITDSSSIIKKKRSLIHFLTHYAILYFTYKKHRTLLVFVLFLKSKASLLNKI